VVVLIDGVYLAAVLLYEALAVQVCTSVLMLY